MIRNGYPATTYKRGGRQGNTIGKGREGCGGGDMNGREGSEEDAERATRLFLFNPFVSVTQELL